MRTGSISRKNALIGCNPVSQAVDGTKSVGSVATHGRLRDLHHLRQCMTWTEVKGPGYAQLSERFKGRRPIDGMRNLGRQFRRCIGDGKDAFPVTSREQQALACNGRRSAGIERLLQGFAGMREPRRMRCDFHGEKARASSVTGSFITEIDHIPLRASDHEKEVGILDCDFAAMSSKCR